MRSAALIVIASMLASTMAVGAAAQPVSKAALAAAGLRATLDQIDYGSHYCDGATTVEEWLKALVDKQARSISWSGGQCVLVHNMRPGFDASSWPYCAQATVTLIHPKNKNDTPIIEIYFEKPDRGRPGVAYAFRGTMMSRDGGPDYIRFRKEFQDVWDERFPPGPESARCQDE